jgi:phosphohistidine phosphatase
MNKTLTIIRHAKADWPDNVADFERPLLERGRNDARMMGEYLNRMNCNFDLVLCSKAKRARQTLQFLQKELPIAEHQITFDEGLYMASVNTVIKAIEALPNSLNRVAIVGHNPTQTDLCNVLTNDHLSNLSTCGVYTIAFEVDDWQAIHPGMGKTVSLITPKLLKD